MALLDNIVAQVTPVVIAGYVSPSGVTSGGSGSPQYGAPVDTLVTSDGTAGTITAGGMALIQNLDDAAVYVKLGSGASSSNFSFVLSAGSAANDGLGGSREIINYAGIVTVAAATGSPRLIFSNFS
jgi:hypothetical protein